jgi:hypothetical protein
MDNYEFGFFKCFDPLSIQDPLAIEDPLVLDPPSNGDPLRTDYGKMLLGKHFKRLFNSLKM